MYEIGESIPLRFYKLKCTCYENSTGNVQIFSTLTDSESEPYTYMHEYSTRKMASSNTEVIGKG